jgi:hypothetical protein
VLFGISQPAEKEGNSIAGGVMPMARSASSVDVRGSNENWQYLRQSYVLLGMFHGRSLETIHFGIALFYFWAHWSSGTVFGRREPWISEGALHQRPLHCSNCEINQWLSR